MRVVLDTNVNVSGLNFDGPERQMLEHARQGRFELVLSEFILEETLRVLQHKFSWSDHMAYRVITLLRKRAEIVEHRVYLGESSKITLTTESSNARFLRRRTIR